MGSGGVNTGSTSTLTSNGHHNYSNGYNIGSLSHNVISVNGNNISNTNDGAGGGGGGNTSYGSGSDQQQTQNIYEDIDQYQQREPPPMIAPVSGVPNLKVRDMS